jgi:chromosome segregation ATPase
MGTGDMHGGTVEFRDRQGNPVNFEMVRVGTTKELETVKAALATANGQINTLRDAKTDLENTGAKRDKALADARAELEDLMSVKASLEETSTALEVRDKELCHSREALTQFKQGMLAALDDHVESHKTWLDKIRGAFSGEETEPVLP